ncbi:MAG: hypothetical protein ACRED4_03070 [Brevundimonas sp.]
MEDADMLSILAALFLQSGGPQPATVDDVVVVGRPQQEQVEAFVAEVAAPANGRGLARWRTSVCVGVVNLQREPATAIVDHVSQVALQQGLRVGEPGCSPNVVIVFAADARGLSAALVSSQPRTFRPGYTGASQGSAALERFIDNPRPVRWWHVSVPYVGETGQVAVRMPGHSAPTVPGAGLVHKGRPIADALIKSIIIVDVPQVEQYSGIQLGDYLALVALAQVDPDAEVEGVDTVLNLFKAPDEVAGLTNWDRNYLAALYEAYPERTDRSDQASAMFRQVRRGEADVAESE